MTFVSDENEEGLVSYKKLPVASLFVPHDFQRDLRPRWVEKRINSFREKKLGTLTVVASTNGRYAVVDGQHRLALIRASGELGEKVPTNVWCEIRQEKSRADEADLFLGRNDAQAVAPLDKFRARIVAGDPRANAIKNILMRYNVAVGKQTGPDSRNYACITTLESLYNIEDLDPVIKIIEMSWAPTFGKTARAEVVVKGVSIFHQAYKSYKQYSLDRSIEKFSEVENFTAFMKRARSDALAKNVSVPEAIALMLLPRYNSGLRSNSLPAGRIGR